MIDTAETIRYPMGRPAYSLLQLQWLEAEIIHRFMRKRFTNKQRSVLRKHKKMERTNKRLGRMRNGS